MLVEVNPLLVTKRPRGRRARREGHGRRQRALPPPGHAPRSATCGDEDPQEQMAKERGLTYVKLDGNVGILGNGAGLVMSTLDVVAQAGGAPANFLDAGGGSKAEAIVSAVEVILSDPKVTAVLFNIFGGITRCDEVANGPGRPRSARSSPTVPFVVRLDGTNDEEGRELLAEADLPNVHVEKTMLGAAAQVVELAGLMTILVGPDTKLVVVRPHRPRGHLPRAQQPQLRHRPRRGRHARQGRPGRRGRAGLQHVPRRRRRDRRQHGDDLRAAALRRRLDPRGRRRRRRAGHRITEGIPAHDMLRVYTHLRARPDAPDRPQLPGHPLARQGQRRDHPGALLLRGQRRPRVALGHADLPDRQRDRPGAASATRRSSASAATRSSARRSSTSSRCSRTTRRPS